ncbi:hypothetical protein G6514_008346 [Epicoccum nigrum]|nr:hypothetical protein G6514_008346 [Epicoccum nigrum]
MQGVTMFPISGFLAMAVEAAAQKALSSKTPWDDIEVEDLAVKSPIMLSEEELEMTIILKKHGDGPDSEATHSFLIQSWSQSKGWSDNCTGAVSLILTKDNEVDGQRARKYRRQHLYSKNVDIGQAATECTSASRLYAQLSKIGVDYGELFQGLEQCHASADGAVAQIVKTDTSNEMPYHYETDYILHPAFMEQLVSLYWPVIAAAGDTNTVHLPASIGRVTVSARALSCPQKPGSALHAICRSETMVSSNGLNRYDMFAVDAASEPIITIQGLSTSPIVEYGSGAETTGPQELCYKLEWEPVPEDEGVNEQALHGFDAEIIIIHGKTKLQYKLVAALTEHLEATLGTRINSGTLEDIAPIAQGKLCLVLTELASPLLATLDAAQFEALKMLLTTVQGALWVIQGAYHSSANPETNMISGFSRTLRSEGTLANFVTLDLDPQDSSDPHHIVQIITRVLHTTLGAAAKVEEKEFRAQGRKLFTPRVLDDSDLNAFVHEQVHPAPTEPARFCDTDRPLRASLGTPGAVETLVFHDDENLRQDLPDSCVDIAVKAVGIGPTDLANGARLGMECSGTVTAVGSMVPNLRVGDRVAAIVTTGCLSNVARVQSQFVFKAPAHMSFEALATMPVAYCTAVYALMKEVRLAEGESILIHNAASAVGQAALTLASRIGASVWVTVKTAEEKETIMQHYPIPQDRIWFSGATYFAERIQSVTKGAGVDVVFNTLIDYRVLRATWASIAQFGRFFNVVGGQQTTLQVPSATSATVYSIDFAALAAHWPSLVHRTLGDVARMVQYGQLRPLLNIASYDAAGTVAALQNISAPQSNGRSAIVFSEEDYVTAPRIEKPSTLLRKDATYILIGGTGGLGRSIAVRMVSRGAQHIVLLSRSGTVRGAAAKEIEDLRAAGANILVRSCDVSDREAVDELIDCDLSSLPPIRGVIHGAMVLDDVLFESMTHAQYTAVVASKLHGAQNFHAALLSHKNSASNLDFFIMISSAAGAVGNRGQAAYAAANTFLNGYAQHLRAAGLNASSLDLTAVSDAGYLAADAAKAAEVMRNLGSDTICLSQVLALVHAGIAGRLKSCNGHPITGMRMGVQQGTRPFWQHDAKFKHLVAAADDADTASSSDASVVPWSTRFRQSASRAEAQSIVAAALVEKIAEVVSMEQAELDTERNLSAYPLDSLTAIEVRNFITRVFESNLQVLELLASGSIRTLAGVVVGKTKVVLPA